MEENKKEAGIMISEIGFSNFPVLLKSAGLDFFILDCEHGGFDYADISRMLMTARLIGLTAVVRVADNSRKDLIKFADMGAGGVLLPMTDCAEDIEKVVRFTKYSPLGRRGRSTMRAHTLYSPPEIGRYMREANGRFRVYAQLETAAGVKNAAEILAVDGVDGCFVGPNDLSDDYGCLENTAAPQIFMAIQEVGAAARTAKKTAGIITGNKIYMSAAKKNGFEMYCKGSELNAVKEYCVAIVRTLQEE